MAPRSIGTGTISFGLVAIPVRLYPATQASASISFHLLHAKCGSRVKQRYVCAQDGEPVEREDLVKGYEVSKDRYVTFSADELAALDEIASQSIDIAEFVSLADVDPVFFDGAYHLGPDRGGGRAYRVLALALERSGKAALARYAARGKQYLVLVRAHGGRLVLQQLRYPDELRSPEEIPLDEAEPKEAEVQLALRLIEQTASDGFHPERYEDGVKKRVLAAIERKVQGQELREAAPEAPAARVIDLVDALEASLARAAAATTANVAVPAPGEAPQPAAAGTPELDAPRKPPRPARPAPTRQAPARARTAEQK